MAKKKKPTKTIDLPQSTEAMIRTRARNLELGVCYINKNWDEIKEATILVTRKHKQGGTTIGVFLVDLAMQGLKDTFYDFNMPPEKYRNFIEDYLEKADHVEVEYVLVHNIVYESILFGENNGYDPPKDFSVSQYILEEDTEDLEMSDIDFGFEEKPTWIDQIDDHEDIFTEYPHFEDQEENEYLSLVKALPNIQLDDISSETVDDETWEKRTDDDTRIEEVYRPDEKPNMEIWNDFYTLCDEIFKLKPWKAIYEDQVFGIRLPYDGKIYFVSIMGILGDHVSLTFYEGIEGVLQFWTFHKGILMNSPDNLLLLNKIDVSWEDREMIFPEQKAIINKLGRKYPGKKAWPQVVQQIRGFVPFTPSEDIMADTVLLLAQSLEVIKQQAQTPELLDRSDFDDFTYLVRSLNESETEMKWISQVETIQKPKDRAYQLAVNENDLRKFKQLPVKWDNLEVGLNILPAPIRAEGTPGAFPFVLIGVDPTNGIGVLMDTMQVKTSYSEMTRQIPSIFIQQCIKAGGRPAKITISEIRLMELALFLQEHSSTKFDMVNEIPAHQDLLDSLMKSL